MLVHPRSRSSVSLPRKAAHAIVDVDGDGVVVLGGAVVLVDDALAWVASHRDAIIAALARAGGADLDDAIGIVDAAVAASAPCGSVSFVDDFTLEELVGAPAPVPLDDDVKDVCDDADTPLSWLYRQLSGLKPRPDVVVEIGPGAGGLSALLGPIAKKTLVVVDVSLRSVLIARQKASDAGAKRVVAVVADACALPVDDGAADVVVAENVVDVVDDADAFIAGAFAALKPGGLFLLTTPEPELDGNDVVARLEAAGFVVEGAQDRLRWPRVHNERHVELWTVAAFRARRPGPT